MPERLSEAEREQRRAELRREVLDYRRKRRAYYTRVGDLRARAHGMSAEAREAAAASLETERCVLQEQLARLEAEELALLRDGR